MSNLFKLYKTDENKERDGVTLEMGVTDDGRPIQFIVARSGGANQRFNKLMELKTRPYRRQIQANTLDQAIMERIAREVYSEAVVIGWNNVDDENGKPVPYSVAKCQELFQQLPDLYLEIVEQSNRLSLYRNESLEADSKNS